MKHVAGKRRRKRSLNRTSKATFATVLIILVGAGGATVAAANQNRATQVTDSGPAALSTAALPTVTPAPTTAAHKPASEPASVTVPTSGEGTFTVATGTSTQEAVGQVITYQVEVENGLPFDARKFAARVDRTLTDRRGWIRNGYSFNRRTRATQRIVLASPSTVDRLCAPLLTRGQVSCRNGNIVVINAVRWAKGAESYRKDLDGYRTYVINHEVGHSLGRIHEPCPGPGSLAPVMHQQTLGLNGCTKNPWP
ncbi:DUF3152 domain-containing protein [Aeromicrobium sp.]|uniref:DUF3152 domain-containing protein n=1 Tax=Aeromicrobium sp. TaxID=1871063 RepID=UPI0030C1EEBF